MGSVGEREQERAFQAWLCERDYHCLGCGHVPQAEIQGIFNLADLRAAFAAGEELRGCCHAHPGNGRLAVRERDA